MTIQVHIDTLNLEDAEASYSAGTVEITIGSKRKAVRCWGGKGRDTLRIYGLAVKYRTGAKIWEGTATYVLAKGYVSSVQGGLDHRARHNTVSLLGFYADYSAEIHSKR